MSFFPKQCLQRKPTFGVSDTEGGLEVVRKQVPGKLAVLSNRLLKEPEWWPGALISRDTELKTDNPVIRGFSHCPGGSPSEEGGSMELQEKTGRTRLIFFPTLERNSLMQLSKREP